MIEQTHSDQMDRHQKSIFDRLKEYEGNHNELLKSVMDSNFTIMEKLFGGEEIAKKSEIRIKFLSLYAEKVRLKGEYDIRAMKEGLTMLLQNGKTTLQTQRAEYALTKVTNSLQRMNELKLQFNEIVQKAYEEFPRITVPRLRESYVSFLNQQIDVHESMCDQFSKDLQQIIQEKID